MKMQLSEIARALDLSDEIPDEWDQIEITNVNFDSRKLEPGALFVPLSAERDGHDFIQAARDAGAVATLWGLDHDEKVPDDIPSLLVKSPLQAFQKLAKYYLDKINPKVVAITGSNGKTTTKDMTAAILAGQYNVVKTEANFNNEIGVPMTILGMSSNTEILVVELGMDRPGQLHFLSQIVQPDIAIITMIGEAHIEFFKTRDKIADAKMEITDYLKEDGLFIFNGDEPLLQERAPQVNVEQYTFGLDDTNTLVASDIKSDADKTTFKVNLDDSLTLSIPMIGAYNVTNALAAIAVGVNYHVKLPRIAESLATFQVTSNRTEWLTGQAGERILSDVYNSNPTAVRAVLRSFSQVATSGKRIVVLGDMLELGDEAEQMHLELADHLNPTTFEEIYLVGPQMQALAQKLENTYHEHVHYYQTDQLSKLTQDLIEQISPDDLILLKASHGIHLEKVVEALI